jgi:hypothetical protein
LNSCAESDVLLLPTPSPVKFRLCQARTIYAEINGGAAQDDDQERPRIRGASISDRTP